MKTKLLFLFAYFVALSAVGQIPQLSYSLPDYEKVKELIMKKGVAINDSLKHNTIAYKFQFASLQEKHELVYDVVKDVIVGEAFLKGRYLIYSYGIEPLIFSNSEKGYDKKNGDSLKKAVGLIQYYTDIFIESKIAQSK